MPAVVASGVGYAYGERRALHGVSFTVEPGELYGVLGPNGSGKSTLFHLLSTRLVPAEGTIAICGADAAREPARVRERLGVVFQSPGVDPHLTVAENLRVHGRLCGLRGAALAERSADVLRRFRLEDRRDERVKSLSGGLRRRVELAKALLPQPSVLVLDEPSTGLDPGARRDLASALDLVRLEDRVAVLLTTHLGEEAERCDRLLLLDRGVRVVEDTPAALRAAVGGEVLALESDDPVALRAAVAAHLAGGGDAGPEPVVQEGSVRLARPEAHRLVPQLVEAFPGRVRAVTVRQPTLEDVFLHHTGHTLWEGAA